MPSESVTQFLRASGRDLSVPDGQTLTVDPTDREWVDVAHRLQIDGFDDLRALHLVPDRLEQQATRQAIADDDAEARQIARRMAENPAGGSQGSCCGSRTTVTAGVESYPDRLRRLYREIRPVTHVNLARVVGDALGVSLAPDSLQATITHALSIRCLVMIAPWWLLALLSKNIEIGKNATLALAPNAKSLWANDIRIHVGGRLVVNSGYIRIRATTVQGNIA